MFKDKKAKEAWLKIDNAIAQSSTVINETEAEKVIMRKKLLNDWQFFCYTCFPNVTKAKFAAFHKKIAKQIINDDQCFVVAEVCRDHAKSSLMAMLLLFLHFKKEIKYVILFSRTKDKAIELLSPIKIAFEQNEILKHYFGEQMNIGNWTEDDFTTMDGIKFRALGMGQNPRGAKTDSGDRPDTQIFDDCDLEEVCNNPERLDKDWEFIEGACMGAYHISGKKRTIFLNNRIGEDALVVRAKSKSTFWIQVNILDKNGEPSWKEAYTLEECRRMIELVGDQADAEYFNRPSIKGTVFQKEWMQYKKMPPLNKYKYLIAYLDGGFKKSKTADTKALILVGMINGEFHIRKAYVDNVSVGEMIDWHYQLYDLLEKSNAKAMWYMEEVFLLSLLYKDFNEAAKAYGFPIPITGDKRKKPDKDLRIAATQGYYQRGNVWFDEAIQEDRHTKRLISQYLKFRVGVRNQEKDGPDATEGAFHLLKKMLGISQKPVFGKRKANKYHY